MRKLRYDLCTLALTGLVFVFLFAGFVYGILFLKKEYRE